VTHDQAMFALGIALLVAPVLFLCAAYFKNGGPWL
jgi:hypothetical protein